MEFQIKAILFLCLLQTFVQIASGIALYITLKNNPSEPLINHRGHILDTVNKLEASIRYEQSLHHYEAALDKYKNELQKWNESLMDFEAEMRGTDIGTIAHKDG